jgi:SCY1-like protein 2
MTYSVLNVDQFRRFMEVIRQLGDRVEREHNQFLRDSQRLEDRSATVTGDGAPAPSFVGTVDFQTLVASGSTSSTMGSASVPPTVEIPKPNGNESWEDDVWGSIFNDNVSELATAHRVFTNS